MDDKQIDIERNRTIKKSNTFIRNSRNDLALEEKKLILFIISQLDETSETEFKEIEFSLVDFCQICGIDYKGSISKLKDIIIHLASKAFWIKNKDGDYTTARWIDKATIKRQSSKVSIRLDCDLIPYLLSLKSNYTTYTYKAILGLNCKYSIEMYEILKSFLYNGECYLSLDYLRERLLLRNKYKRIYDFNKNVLEVVQEEINLYTDIFFEYQAKREGKNIVGYYFKLEENDMPETTIEMRLKGQLPTRHREEQAFKEFMKGQQGKGEINE